MKRAILGTLALVLVAGIVAAEPVKESSPAPPFTVQTLEGKTVRLSDLKGKVILLDFGAINCPPCKLEMPFLESWYKKYKDKGFVVLGLLEMNPKAADARKMVKERGLTFPVAIDTREEIGKRYGLEAHPTTVLIDRSGKVIKAETGYIKGDEKSMEAALVPLLSPDIKEAPKR